jgi:hypothetical protein
MGFAAAIALRISVFKNRLSGAGTGPACFRLPPAGTVVLFEGKTKGTEKRYVYLVSVPI